ARPGVSILRLPLGETSVGRAEAWTCRDESRAESRTPDLQRFVALRPIRGMPPVERHSELAVRAGCFLQPSSCLGGVFRAPAAEEHTTVAFLRQGQPGARVHAAVHVEGRLEV